MLPVRSISHEVEFENVADGWIAEGRLSDEIFSKADGSKSGRRSNAPEIPDICYTNDQT